MRIRKRYKINYNMITSYTMVIVSKVVSPCLALHENKIICSGWEGRKTSYLTLLSPSNIKYNKYITIGYDFSITVPSFQFSQ